MVAPRLSQCGVAAYTDYLTAELRKLVEIAHVTDSERFRAEMNAVDLIHVQHQYFLFGGVAPWRNRFKRLLRQLSRPVVLTAHEFVTPEGGYLRRSAVSLANLAQFGNPAIRKIIVHTDIDRSRMIQAGFAPGRIVVVRHGVPNAPHLSNCDDARAKLDLTGRFIMTIFGFLSARKGHRQAIDSMLELPGNVMLILAGGRHPDDRTTYCDNLQQQIVHLKLQDRVRITGYLAQADVLDVMSATDLVVAPFKVSSGSGSLALAFACGKPILASDIEPHREISSEEPGSLALYPSDPPVRLAAEIHSLLENPDRRNALAAGAMRYAESHSYEHAARQTVDIYNSVLGEVR